MGVCTVSNHNLETWGNRVMYPRSQEMPRMKFGPQILTPQNVRLNCDLLLKTFLSFKVKVYLCPRGSLLSGFSGGAHHLPSVAGRMSHSLAQRRPPECLPFPLRQTRVRIGFLCPRPVPGPGSVFATCWQHLCWTLESDLEPVSH